MQIGGIPPETVVSSARTGCSHLCSGGTDETLLVGPLVCAYTGFWFGFGHVGGGPVGELWGFTDVFLHLQDGHDYPCCSEKK